MKLYICVFVLVLSLNSGFGAPTTTTETTSTPLIVVADSSTTEKNDEVAVDEPLPKSQLYSMKVISKVNSRYATTVVSSRVANPAKKAQEVTFAIVLPETAFISGFLMEIEGKVYKAYVKEKEAAKQEYQHAIQSGLGAAHVAVSARDSNRFTVSVNVEPMSKATFNLTYEELLTRRLDVYNLVLNLHPGQIVRDLSVDVDIVEHNKISLIRTPTLRSGNEVDADENTDNNQYAVIEYKNPEKTHAHITFAPTVEQQKLLLKEKNVFENDDVGISGQFVVQYDVVRDVQGGEIMVYDGYFVHFFAPSNLKPLNKHAIFVLDVSGSMVGRKIVQLKEAMLAILDDLKPGDQFNLIEFSFGVKVFNLDNPENSIRHQSTGGWYYRTESPPPPLDTVIPAYQATPENIEKAKKVINSLEAGGGTNIYDALTTALKLAQFNSISQAAIVPELTIPAVNGTSTTVAPQTSEPLVQKSDAPEPLIIFLTDGDPTVGETNTKKILTMISELNSGKRNTALFALAFGEDADRGFLKQIALRNSGFMRHIYEAADASIQLQHFYKQISSPLLTGVTFKYPPDQIEELTDTGFHILFSGSELVVAGRLAPNKDVIDPQVSAYTIGGPIDFIPKIIPIPEPEKQNKPSLERLWAYLTIKQLLDKKDIQIDPVIGPIVEKPDFTTESSKDKEDKIKESPEKQALKLALKYSFVTSLTSLVVVKPNSTSAVEAEEAKATPDSNTHFTFKTASSGLQPMISLRSGVGAPVTMARSVSSRRITGLRRGRGRGRHRGHYHALQSGFAAAAGPAFSGGALHAPVFTLSGPPPRHDSMQSSLAYIPNRISGPPGSIGFALTTTPRPPPRPPIYTTTRPQKLDLKHLHLDSLTWLQDIAVSNDEIQLPTGIFKLGIKQNTTDFDPCEKTISGNPGTCMFLSTCTDALPTLINQDAYTPYFCDIKGYAGICCDDQSP